MNEAVKRILNDKQEYEKRLTEYVRELKERADHNKLEELAKIRKMPIEVLEEHDIFYIGNMVEMMLPNYLNKLEEFGIISQTNRKPIFNERWVIPIKNREGLVQNLVGYSPYSEERYIYGTAKYYRRRNTLFGLENLDTAYELGYAILTEGITDAIRLRSIGYKNSFGNCGTFKSNVSLKLLNRCRYGVIKIPDRDKAGMEAEKNWEVLKGITIITPIRYKDCDEMLREKENEQYFIECLSEVIQMITEQEHGGKKYENKTFTLL